jgi:hypothetical protein
MTGLLAASLALSAAGCGARPERHDEGPPTNPERKADTGAAVQITLDVRGMTKALGIT